MDGKWLLYDDLPEDLKAILLNRAEGMYDDQTDEDQPTKKQLVDDLRFYTWRYEIDEYGNYEYEWT